MPSPAEAAAQYAAQGAFQAAASQGSAMGLHVGNTTNRPTRLVSSNFPLSRPRRFNPALAISDYVS